MFKANNAENRMISSSKEGLTITYAYDFMGRRVDAARQRADGVAKRSGADPIPLMRERGECGRVPSRRTREQMKSDFGTWNFTKRFIWDGWNLIADIWGPANNYALTCTYVWGIDVSGTVGGAGGVGGLALMYYNGRAFIPLQDGRGNIHGYLDTTTLKNAVSWDFTAYGEAIHVRGGLAEQYGTQDFLFRYQSKMQDMEGNLLYFGHRFYHPGMGRFPNRDPIGEAGGLNLYGYVRNNPVNRRDYLGLNEDDVIVNQPFNVWGTAGGGRAGGFGSGGGGGFGGAPSDWDDGTNRNVEDPAKDGTGQQEEWKPNEEDCRSLEQRFGRYIHATPRTPFSSMAEAAIGAAFYATPLTSIELVEYGGYIYTQQEYGLFGEPSYYFSTPRTDNLETEVRTRTLWSSLLAEILTRTIVADYHIHPTHITFKFGGRGDYDNFSPYDRASTIFSRVPLFLFNDTGTMKMFLADPNSRSFIDADKRRQWWNAGRDKESVPEGSPTIGEYQRIRACQKEGFIK